MRNRFVSLLVIGIMLLGIAAPTRAQTTAVDPTTLQYQALAGEAARNILTLAGSRDFNSMYDLMHPDSKRSRRGRQSSDSSMPPTPNRRPAFPRSSASRSPTTPGR